MNRQKEMFSKYKKNLKKKEFQNKLKMQRRKFHEEDKIREKVSCQLKNQIYNFSQEDFDDLVEESIHGYNVNEKDIEFTNMIEKDYSKYDEGFLENISEMCSEIENDGNGNYNKNQTNNKMEVE